MKLFQKLFNKPKPVKQETTVRRAKNFRAFKADRYLALKTIQGDDESFFTGQKAMVLDVVPATDTEGKSFTKANKLCYENINYITNLSYDQFVSVSQVTGLPAEKYEERFYLWPTNLSEEQYKQLYNILKIQFIQEVPLPVTNDNLYVISINEEFYLRSNWTPLKFCGIDTVEKSYLPEEFLHNNTQDAVKYACVITNRLWAGAPDNAHFFTERILQEIEEGMQDEENREVLQPFQELLQTYKFKGLGYEFREHNNYYNRDKSKEVILSMVKEEYNSISEKYMDEIEMLLIISKYINNPPFFITRTTV